MEHRSIEHYLEADKTGMCGWDSFTGRGIDLVIAGSELSTGQPVETDEWVLSGRVSVRFNCISSEFGHAMEVAKRVLMAKLYGGFLVDIRRLQLAIESGDKDEAWRLCCRLEDRVLVK